MECENGRLGHGVDAAVVLYKQVLAPKDCLVGLEPSVIGATAMHDNADSRVSCLTREDRHSVRPAAWSARN